MRYLLDTTVISELVARPPNAQVVRWIDALDANSVYLSVITTGELRKGIEKLADSRRKDTPGSWLTDDLMVRFDNRVLPLDVAVMLTWGQLTGRLERVGRPLPAIIDSLIAALAIHHSCSLVTRNEDDFKATGVTVLNPWK